MYVLDLFVTIFPEISRLATLVKDHQSAFLVFKRVGGAPSDPSRFLIILQLSLLSLSVLFICYPTSLTVLYNLDVAVPNHNQSIVLVVQEHDIRF